MSDVTVTEPPKVPPINMIPETQHGNDQTRLNGELNVLLKGSVSGSRLQITADVDLEGLARLKEVLSKYEEIMKLMNPESKAH